MTLTEGQKKQIVACIADVLEVDPIEIHEETNFRKDFSADSLRAVEILVQLERMFKITIKQEKLAGMLTLHGVYEVIEESLATTAQPVGTEG